MKTEQLQLVVSFGSEPPRIFTIAIRAPVSDVREAISAGARAFDGAVSKSLERSMQAHAANVIDRAA